MTINHPMTTILRGLAHVVLLVVLVLSLVGSAHASFGIQPGSFVATATDDDGDLLTQAGGHPNATTSFEFNTINDPALGVVPDEDLKDLEVRLPPGVIGDPNATPQCQPADFAQIPPVCPVSTQVGTMAFHYALRDNGDRTSIVVPVYNLVPADGKVAQFGFLFIKNFVVVSARVRTEGDYGVTATVQDTPGGILLYNSKFTLWGVPADPAHDTQRFFPGTIVTGSPAGIVPRPFFINPSLCGPTASTSISVRSWQNPGAWFEDAAESPDVTGCERLVFSPSLEAAATASSPDTPSGLNLRLAFAQNDNPNSVSAPALRDARVTLPAGMTINPASADGLGACADDQLNLKSRDPVSCPDSSKIGTVSATTPVLAEKLTGAVYLRSQASDDPASGEMFRIALVLENAKRGLSVRLPGEVKADPDTGRIVTEFHNNPQVPVSEVSVTLKGGPRAPLANPSTCGPKSIDAHLTSWSAQTADRSSASTVDCTPGLGGFGPSFSAGTVNPVAGATSALTVQAHKPDGQADLYAITLSMPPGLLAHLKDNIGARIGTAKVAAGPGANPFWLSGPVVLEGPYGDAPFSLRVTVPAIAGPFNLGDVVVRQKIHVDPITAQVTVISDPLPTIVKGVPVRLQNLQVDVDKPGFMLNPTSCTPTAFSGTLGAIDGQRAAINDRFQVGSCNDLALTPTLALTLTGKGQNKDGGHPAVTANLTQTAGQANLKKVRVALPLSLALDPDNAASDDLCSFVEGSKPDPKCPASSVVGRATAISPILNQPLSGPVYFTKNERKDPKSGRSIKTTPKLVIPLVGENGVKLTLTGTSTVVNDQLVTTFDNIPDAPVSSFKMDITGGKKGILVVSGTDICTSTQIANQQIDGQNNKNADTDVSIQTPSCPLKVLSKKVAKGSVAVKVGGLGAGKVTVSGKGIKKTTKTITKSTVATITAKRTTGTPGKVTVSFDPSGPAKARKATK